MPSLTAYPLGNADSLLVELANEKLLLFDFADTHNPDDEACKYIDLSTTLRTRLRAKNRTSLDIVAFTHLDRDHYQGASAFFSLAHSAAYQGGERIAIDTLWVPACLITEPGHTDEAAIIQREARYRLKRGEGIRVFSRPAALRDWLAREGLTIESRAACLVDAGTLVPGLTRDGDGVEFFVHSPFAKRVGGTLIDRNADSLVFQATFVVDGVETYLMLCADAPHDALSDLVEVTKSHGNEQRLAWDIFKLPHHCSYLSLSAEKGKDKTAPDPEIRWLFEQGRQGGKIIAKSEPIPATDTDQPPHRQAAAYYEERRLAIGGEFLVTMAHPSVDHPAPLVIDIGRLGATINRRIAGSGISATTQRSPRFGALDG